MCIFTVLKVKIIELQVRGAKHRSTRVTNPTTEEKFTRQTPTTEKKFTVHEGVKPHNANLGSVLLISIFLLTGLFVVVFVCYILTYTRWGRSKCTKHFPTTADMHPLEILDINEEDD